VDVDVYLCTCVNALSFFHTHTHTHTQVSVLTARVASLESDDLREAELARQIAEIGRSERVGGLLREKSALEASVATLLAESKHQANLITQLQADKNASSDTNTTNAEEKTTQQPASTHSPPSSSLSSSSSSSSSSPSAAAGGVVVDSLSLSPAGASYEQLAVVASLEAKISELYQQLRAAESVRAEVESRVRTEYEAEVAALLTKHRSEGAQLLAEVAASQTVAAEAVSASQQHEKRESELRLALRTESGRVAAQARETAALAAAWAREREQLQVRADRESEERGRYRHMLDRLRDENLGLVRERNASKQALEHASRRLGRLASESENRQQQQMRGISARTDALQTKSDTFAHTEKQQQQQQQQQQGVCVDGVPSEKGAPLSESDSVALKLNTIREKFRQLKLNSACVEEAKFT
jgi:hypothetical protein